MADRDNDREPTETAELALVRALARVLTGSELSEIEFEKDGCRIRLSRQAAPVVVAAPAPAVAAAAMPAGAPAAAEAGDEQALLSHPGVLPSPMVGVCYTSPEPGAPPFFRVGDEVRAGDTVVLIEAMKVFNPIAAPKAGRIRHVFVGNGQPVEYGEPLLIIE
jgi:acetyl-CoA carboxylase biotin carboxyl carrier protein